MNVLLLFLPGAVVSVAVPLPVLVAIIVIIAGLALWRYMSWRSSRAGRMAHPARGLRVKREIKKRIDHGAMIAKKHGKARSTEWPRVEKEHLQRQPACVACGHTEHVQVHHVKPFHLHPQLELEPTNLITLCEAPSRDHHLLLGHLDEWESFNEHVHADVKHFFQMTADQIRADANWLKKVQSRPK